MVRKEINSLNQEMTATHCRIKHSKGEEFVSSLLFLGIQLLRQKFLCTSRSMGFSSQGFELGKEFFHLRKLLFQDGADGVLDNVFNDIVRCIVAPGAFSFVLVVL